MILHEKIPHRVYLISLAVIAYFFLMFGRGALSLTYPDEVFYAQTTKEMILHDSWMTPYLFDAPQFEKPIFFYWLLQLAFKVGGMTSVSARFWPGLFGVLGILVTYWLAYMILKSKRAAFISGLILCSSAIYFVLSRAVLIDIVFAFWVTLSLTLFYLAYSRYKNGRCSQSAIVFCWACMGLAVLTKGILGLVLPVLTIVVFLLVERKIFFLFQRAHAIGLILFLVIVLPWHWLMLKNYGVQFVDEYWKNVHLRRLVEAEHLANNSWYFYFLTIVVGIFPWSLFLFSGGGMLLKRFKTPGHEPSQILFLLIWISVIFIVFQQAQSKLASYILPLFPALAILLGFYLEQTESHGHHLNLVRSFKLTGYLMSGLFILSPIVFFFVGRHHQAIIGSMHSVYLLSAGMILLGLVAIVALRMNKRIVFLMSQASILFIVLFIAFSCRDVLENWTSCRNISAELNQRQDSLTPVLVSKRFVRAVKFFSDHNVAALNLYGKNFFSRHPIPVLLKDYEVIAFIKKYPQLYCVVRRSDREDLERLAPERFNIHYLSTHADKYLLRISPLNSD